MPCRDITDYLELQLDKNDHIKTYRLRKLTCGKDVGGSLLLPHIKGKHSDFVLRASVEVIIPDFTEKDETEMFLYHKQLFSIQSALATLTGKEPGYQVTPFEIENVDYDQFITYISGYIALDHLTVEEIKACGNCACATSKSAKLKSKKVLIS